MIKLYGIKSCDTVRKASQWLRKSNIDFSYHDFRVDGLESKRLVTWVKHLGWKPLLNTRSTSWRQLEESKKLDIDETKAINLMLDNPTLIKRPVLEYSNGDVVCYEVGFKESRYEELFSN